MVLSRSARLLLGLASGALLALAFPPYNVPLLAWICLAVLLIASFGASGWLAFLCGLLHGFAFHMMSIPWIYTVMRVHGGLGAAAAGGVLALMVLVLSLFPAIFAWTARHFWRTSRVRACFAAPCVWVILEYAQMHMPALGFPWNLLGYGVARNLALVQLASLTGIYGLSFLAAAYSALLACAVEPAACPEPLPCGRDKLRRREPSRMVAGGPRYRWAGRQGVILLACTLALFLVEVFGPGYVPRQEPRHVAYLVQTNFPQSPSYPADWMDRHAAELDELESLSVRAARAQPGLVVWPEVPAPFQLLDAKFAARAQRMAQSSGSYFLVGVVGWKPGPQGYAGPFNSAALLDPAGRRVFHYDKIHLVPFGEYVPLRRVLTFARQLTAEVGEFQPGTQFTIGELGADPAAGLRGGKFGAFICFEAVFPAEVRQFVAGGAELLINLSNDGWFGRSGAPEQHLAMARVRAVEERRWLLRDTNNGHTAVVDPYGRIEARLEPDRRGVLAAPYDFRSDRTLYARWGDWFVWLCLGGVGASAFRKKQASKEAKAQGKT
jgi:apolipoprotein N-acyltransferase